MPSYQLNIKFEKKDLPNIYAAKEKIVIVKHVQGNEGSHLAWVTFKPFEYNNINWETSFALYASTSEVQSGAIINKMSDVAAVTKVNYDFSNAIFENPEPDNNLGSNTYSLINKMSDYQALTFGLAQSVIVNNIDYKNHPINAIYVPYGHSATMTPIERIDVFLQADINESTVVSRIKSESLLIEYTGNDVLHSIIYDSSIGKFIPMN